MANLDWVSFFSMPSIDNLVESTDYLILLVLLKSPILAFIGYKLSKRKPKIFKNYQLEKQRVTWYLISCRGKSWLRQLVAILQVQIAIGQQNPQEMMMKN